jgi:hypothetical protein
MQMSILDVQISCGHAVNTKPSSESLSLQNRELWDLTTLSSQHSQSNVGGYSNRKGDFGSNDAVVLDLMASTALVGFIAPGFALVLSIYAEFRQRGALLDDIGITLTDNRIF